MLVANPRYRNGARQNNQTNELIEVAQNFMYVCCYAKVSEPNLGHEVPKYVYTQIKKGSLQENTAVCIFVHIFSLATSIHRQFYCLHDQTKAEACNHLKVSYNKQSYSVR